MFGDASWASGGPGWRQGQEQTHNTLSVGEGPRNSMRTVQPGGVSTGCSQSQSSQCQAWDWRVPGASGSTSRGTPGGLPDIPGAWPGDSTSGGEERKWKLSQPCCWGEGAGVGAELFLCPCHAPSPTLQGAAAIPQPQFVRLCKGLVRTSGQLCQVSSLNLCASIRLLHWVQNFRGPCSPVSISQVLLLVLIPVGELLILVPR